MNPMSGRVWVDVQPELTLQRRLARRLTPRHVPHGVPVRPFDDTLRRDAGVVVRRDVRIRRGVPLVHVDPVDDPTQLTGHPVEKPEVNLAAKVTDGTKHLVHAAAELVRLDLVGVRR
jgi:hypothetical protein